MKTSFVLGTVWIATISACLYFSAPAFGDDGNNAALISQARDLVHQAWNPDGDPPSDNQRTALLNKALKLLQQLPPPPPLPHHVHFHGDLEIEDHVGKAIQDISGAISGIQNGTPADQVTAAIQDADVELSRANS
jgi:hypothetical protein